jgi:hypothetical protein
LLSSVEDWREASNDHYSKEDLFLQTAKVDCESKILNRLLSRIDEIVPSVREEIVSMYTGSDMF